MTDSSALNDLYRLQERIRTATEEMGQARFYGESQDGLVRATTLGTGQLVDLDISPKVYRNPDSKGLALAVVEAVTEAGRAAAEAKYEGLRELTGGAGSLQDMLEQAREVADRITDGRF